MANKPRKDKDMLTVRFKSRRSFLEFQVAAELQGGNASQAVRQFAYELIHKVRERDPERFEAVLQTRLADPPRSPEGFASTPRRSPLKRVK